jgi:uncharacterized membrane protein YfcA
MKMPELAAWQWVLGVFCAFMIGVAKTGAPGVGTLIVPFMVLLVGDARQAAAWTAPIMSVADVFAVIYWRRHAEARRLLALIPWVAVGMAAGAAALSLPESVLRRIIGAIVLTMLAVYIKRRLSPGKLAAANSGFYGMATGFATTVANAAGPVMNMYLLTQSLPKEIFVATGAWFFFAVNLSKVPIYAWYHLFSRPSLVFDLSMIPAVICGAVTGRWLLRAVPQRLFEILVIALTAVSTLFLFR